MKVSDLVDKLRYKLSDPEFDKFAVGLQVAYLERGYAKLTRLLSSVMRTQKPLFAYNLTDKTAETSPKGIIGASGILSVKNLYVKSSRDKEWVKPQKINPEDFIEALYQKGGVHTPSASNVVYTVLGSEIRLLPETTYSYHLLAEWNTVTLTMETDLNIPHQYIDLLLTIASLEGMQDLGAQDKVGIYQGELNYHLQVLGQYSTILEQREGRSINGD